MKYPPQPPFRLAFILQGFDHAHSPKARTAMTGQCSYLLYNCLRLHITYSKWTWFMYSDLLALLVITSFIPTEYRSLEHINSYSGCVNLDGISALDVCFYFHIVLNQNILGASEAT